MISCESVSPREGEAHSDRTTSANHQQGSKHTPEPLLPWRTTLIGPQSARSTNMQSVLKMPGSCGQEFCARVWRDFGAAHAVTTDLEAKKLAIAARNNATTNARLAFT